MMMMVVMMMIAIRQKLSSSWFCCSTTLVENFIILLHLHAFIHHELHTHTFRTHLSHIPSKYNARMHNLLYAQASSTSSQNPPLACHNMLPSVQALQ